MSGRRTINALLLAAVIAIFAVPLALRLNTDGLDEGQAYAGSDASATTAIEQIDPGYRPWFTPWFEPSSGEIESGLFAVQAALGAGLLGFALGRLSGRPRPTTAATTTADTIITTTADTTAAVPGVAEAGPPGPAANPPPS